MTDARETISTRFDAMERRLREQLDALKAERAARRKLAARAHKRAEARRLAAGTVIFEPLPVWGEYRPSSGISPIWIFIAEDVDSRASAGSPQGKKPRATKKAKSAAAVQPAIEQAPRPQVHVIDHAPTPKPARASILNSGKVFAERGSTTTLKRNQKVAIPA